MAEMLTEIRNRQIREQVNQNILVVTKKVLMFDNQPVTQSGVFSAVLRVRQRNSCKESFADTV